MAERDHGSVIYTRNGYDFGERFPLAVAAIRKLPVRSCLIDGEAIVCDANGLPLSGMNLLRLLRVPARAGWSGSPTATAPSVEGSNNRAQLWRSRALARPGCPSPALRLRRPLARFGAEALPGVPAGPRALAHGRPAPASLARLARIYRQSNDDRKATCRLLAERNASMRQNSRRNSYQSTVAHRATAWPILSMLRRYGSCCDDAGGAPSLGRNRQTASGCSTKGRSGGNHLLGES